MNSSKSSSYMLQISIIGLLFAVFGLVTWLNGILIPFLKTSCELTDQQSYYVATAFFAAYFFLALPSSWILNKTGTKNGMVIGLLIMAIGTFVFIPAAGSRSYTMFLTGLFIQGTGLALLQTAANPYVSVIGPIESAATRISIMGICNKLMGIVGNLVLAAVLLKDSDAIKQQIKEATDATAKNQLLDQMAQRVETPYIALSVILIAAAIVIRLSSLPDLKEQTGDEGSVDTNLSREKTSVTQFSHLWLGALAIFLYVGAEVMAGDLIGTYGKNLGFQDADTKFFTSFGLIGLLLGYLASIILIPKFVSQDRWLAVSAILGIILTVTSYFVGDKEAVFCLASLGFANAVMWPAIFPLGIKNLGRFTQTGSALLIMGISGGALIPPLYGYLYENHVAGLDFRSAFLVIMVICYVYILWFGLSGHKIGQKD